MDKSQNRSFQNNKPAAANLTEELQKCQKERDEFLNGWKRAKADFLNYKKEGGERIKEILIFANCDLILKILPILDNFELVERKLPEDLSKDDNVKGILQIKNQLKDFLKNQGVERIECLGKKFDPNFQEAVEEIVSKDKEPGIVVEEIQKGYLINGKVIRPARVKVSK